MRAGRTLHRHKQNGGFTLIEMIATIALVTIGVVGVTYAVASAERIATVNQQQAQLASAMRVVTDYLRDSNSGTGLPYTVCATTANYNSNLSGLANHPSKPSGIDWTITKVYESTTGTRSGHATAAIATCAGGGGDWGVQEIVVTVCTPSCSLATHSLSRTIWKADA